MQVVDIILVLSTLEVDKSFKNQSVVMRMYVCCYYKSWIFR